MVSFKGRLGIKQLIFNKPVRFGIKPRVPPYWLAAAVNFDIYVEKAKKPREGGGALEKFRQGCSCHFFGFEISQFVIFLGLLKMRVIFWGLKK